MKLMLFIVLNLIKMMMNLKTIKSMRDIENIEFRHLDRKELKHIEEKFKIWKINLFNKTNRYQINITMWFPMIWRLNNINLIIKTNP